MKIFWFVFAVFQLSFGLINIFVNPNGSMLSSTQNIIVSSLIASLSIPLFVWAFPIKKVESVNQQN